VTSIGPPYSLLPGSTTPGGKSFFRRRALAFTTEIGHRRGQPGWRACLSAPAYFARKPEGRRDGHGVSDRQEKEEASMALYEHVFLARQDLAQAQVDALAEVATKIVEDSKGKVVKTESWGLRSLAYRIAKNRKAHYVMLQIDGPAGVVAELERQTAINEDVIRWLTVRGDEHEGGPSVQMRKNDRERAKRREREEF
jgi:small subunit ribosomal protein S6